MKKVAILSAALVALGNNVDYIKPYVKQEYKPLKDYSPDRKAFIKGKTKKEKKLKKKRGY